MKFEEILECSKSNLLEEMRRKDLDTAKKEATRWKEEVQTKVDEQDALKKEMIRVIQGTSGLDREMIQQMVNENKEALLIAQTNLEDSEKKLKEIEEQNQKAERNCSDLFTWASTYKGASFERRQAILKQFIKEVRVGRDYNIEIVLMYRWTNLRSSSVTQHRLDGAKIRKTSRKILKKLGVVHQMPESSF